jgi:energy-coupling factor transporter ATP-binding protein EcfA2
LQKVSYNINGVSLLQDIDLEIPSSQIISITGPNGSGKTTLGKILCGQLKPFKGKVICHNPRVKTAFLFEDPQAQLICDTVQDEVYFAARNFALPREFPDYLLHIFNLQSLQFNSPLHLSHGQQTKTAFAAILSHNPELVILDEPTQGQDPSAIKYLISFLKSLAIAGKAVVI